MSENVKENGKVEESPRRSAAHWVDPPPRRRPPQPVPVGEQTEAPSPDTQQRPASSRIGLPKGMRGKRQPTGDYTVGYARPPVHSQFAPGNRAGGRKKGSKSQASIMRKELDAKQHVRIDGRSMKLSQRELAMKMFTKKAFERSDPKLLKQMLDYAEKLFPDKKDGGTVANPLSDARLDQQILGDLFAGLGLGQAAPDGDDIFSSLGLTQPDLTADFNDGDWNDDTSNAEVANGCEENPDGE